MQPFVVICCICMGSVLRLRNLYRVTFPFGSPMGIVVHNLLGDAIGKLVGAVTGDMLGDSVGQLVGIVVSELLGDGIAKLVGIGELLGYGIDCT